MFQTRIREAFIILGAAVDITICTNDGVPLDMGAGFDEFAEIAYPSMEYHFLKTGALYTTAI